MQANLKNGEACLDGTLQQRGVHDVKGEALLRKVLCRPVAKHLCFSEDVFIHERSKQEHGYDIRAHSQK